MKGLPMLAFGGRGKAPVAMIDDDDDELVLELPKAPNQMQDFLSKSNSYIDGDVFISTAWANSSQAAAEITALADLEALTVLGQGSTAVVSLVRHKRTGRTYALKEMAMSIEESVRTQIKKELAINQRKREHVVECYQTFYRDGKFSIILEYMDAGALSDTLMIMERILEPDLAVVARQALLGLQSLHNDHIIHRDIKPSNILLSRRGEVKITDFGVSTVLTSTLDVGNTFVGTYTYMSPERISPSGFGHSYNSDTWSLGLTLLECAIGFFPYLPPKESGWSNFYELLNTVVETPAPGANPDHFSPEFCSFIADCLQKDPKSRPTAAECLAHPFIRRYAGHSLSDDFLSRLGQ
eukprot:TRINITY_DN1907_c0_g1_i3.p1 TRINITY_DN1907_c0_g1~~TRINITY_DN1907_c0_g1_i3.p1  ORF type:complete len:353 (+),score=59.99 TRINITY_DN1907_c0_g1_i3:770-1828(+)